ncbi:hypothetical protein ERX46_04195 [Brumimicrobium glaciale]|uniref:Uncharacterized protein n=1 Tax=Brumimicrobium glaciale TaxID=200475 RepID=A0A4Q4KMN2_9FLAO|nr:hypothetical protein [Brumimicrobium glaciale]RYM34582.1 hypothetical protein ERX46_04195 [Brumimicrobium glaciale]
MSLAYPKQNLKDWFTQQWVILWGKKIDAVEESWLMGPFGDLGSISDDFIVQFAKSEGLIIQRNTTSHGLISPFMNLNLSENEFNTLSTKVIDFYEKTADYNLKLSVKWNPLFKFFGVLVNKLFSRRISQLNIPTGNLNASKALSSEIITLVDPKTKLVKHTIWFRTIKSSGQTVYSGVYSTCKLPSGNTCVKAVFPLPKGNATVIMTPSVDEKGALILNSSGRKFGDAGFYFLLTDSKGNLWSQYLMSFRDKLIVSPNHESIIAEQSLTLWHLKVLRFNYEISLKSDSIDVE